MSDGSKIEWTDATWNPITGCSIVSPGCTNCYAMKLAGTRLRNIPSRAGLTKDTKAGPVWTGEVRFNEGWLDQPLKWKRPRLVFVCAHGDLFAEGVPDEWIDKVFAVMALCPQHTFQVLTKRAARMREYLTTGKPAPILDMSSLGNPDIDPEAELGARIRIAQCLHRMVPVKDWQKGNVPWPLPNVWLGVSTERQLEANERIPHLLQTPAAARFISAEPLLGPIDLTSIIYSHAAGGDPDYIVDATSGQTGWKDGDTWEPSGLSRKLDWVIVGGESGTGARPMHPAWPRALRDQCEDAGVPFFFKQWGAWLPWTQFEGAAAIEDHPEQTRYSTMEFKHGRWHDVGFPMWCDAVDGNIDDAHCAGRVGKTAAGRLLDGVEYNGMPTRGSHEAAAA